MGKRPIYSTPLLLLFLIATMHPAKGHGIAGNRLFPGTLTFDDPAVADELQVTPSDLKHPAEDGGLVTDASALALFLV